jgi:hypothetical protein
MERAAGRLRNEPTIQKEAAFASLRALALGAAGAYTAAA